MPTPELDDVDRAILHELQVDARNNTNAAISEAVGVSASTVGKRIRRLEEAGVVTGYRTTLDYERAGYALSVLFHCVAPVAERHTVVERLLELDRVVNVRELMTGEANVHVLVVGTTKADITATARAIDDLDVTITDETLLRTERDCPSVQFGTPDSD